MTIDWSQRLRLFAAAPALALAILAAPSSASAFCGFYVGGAGSEMFNDATNVVLMREGTKTVLSMQNRYEGPLKDFAMVIPVPVVLQEANVKTLSNEVFKNMDLLTSPRLVEYWEQDPCGSDFGREEAMAGSGPPSMDAGATEDDGGVTVEAQFTVGEYDIVILSTNESTALENWLTENNYNIPQGAAPYFEPYVQGDMYFFVAKVDPAKVTFDGTRAVLSPLRFHYDSEDFQLPIRLGMINSRGEQDLIVYTLGKEQRYELANYPNVTIPTNIEVVDAVRNDFASFYTTLFAATVAQNPGAAVTEYAWGLGGCDPCPGPLPQGLPEEDFLTLGGDILDPTGGTWGWTVTRLHLRLGVSETAEDLVFREASGIAGGNETRGADGRLVPGAVPSGGNSFQGRYIIRHPWTGEVTCENPEFGRWGGRNGGDEPATTNAMSPNSTGGDVSTTGAGANADLPDLVVDDIPELSIEAGGARAEGPENSGTGSSAKSSDDGGCSTVGGGVSSALAMAGLGVGALAWRARRRIRREG